MKRRSKLAALRELAATCYAGLGAEHDLPEAWLDALSDAAAGRPFSVEGLLPYTASRPPLDYDSIYEAVRGTGYVTRGQADEIARLLLSPKAPA